jgi:hypothetical protein
MKKKVITLFIILVFVTIPISSSLSVLSEDEISNFSNSDWYQISQDGYGDKTNVGHRGIAIFNDSLILGTANYIANDIERGVIQFDRSTRLYKFLIDLLLKKSYEGNSYISNGCEIWCYNGQTFTQLVGKNGYMPSGFGNKNNSELGELVVFKGYLYACLRNTREGCQVWRTNNLMDWEKVVEGGFGNLLNRWCMETEIFGDYLYVGTYNFIQGCEVYRTLDGVFWEEVVGRNAETKNGFGRKQNFYTWSMCNYSGFLYIGTQSSEGGELWRSQDGIKWEPIVAYKNIIRAKLHGVDYPRGFGRYFAGGFRNMIVYKDELYILTAGEWYLNIGISKIGTVLPLSHVFLSLYPLNYLVAPGAQVWKYNATIDKITRVVGGRFRGNFSAGFGDKRNVYLWCVEVINNNLYVGVMHEEPINVILKRNRLLNWNITIETPKGRGQLWKYDSKNWEQVVGDGFGDDYNIGIREIKFYNNSLIAATFNLKTGCEVWKYDF